MKSRFQSSHIDITGFNKILEIVFNYNIFKFKGKYYKQIKGIAMGSKCGPSIANLFVYILEIKFLNIHRPIYYRRFIDDIFIIINQNFDINILINSFGSLKLNVQTDKTINFLDLLISICSVTQSLKFKMFLKPTNTFCYLPTSSNHPSSIFSNIPKSILLRPRKICNSLSDFLYYARLILFQLVSRGYDFSTIRKVINMVSNLDRNTLLEYKVKEDFKLNNQIIFKFPFDINFINIKPIIINSFESLKNNFSFLKDKHLRILNYMEPNLGKLLVHGFKLNDSILENFNYRKCFNLNCKICLLADNSYFIKLNNSFNLPLYTKSSCNSTGIIYVIKCVLCNNVYYIGESGNSVKTRLSSHISKIKNFSPFSPSNTNISKHFNLLGHNYLQHLKFFILIKNCDDKTIRRNYENQFIRIFENWNLSLLNDREDLNRKFDLFFTKTFHYDYKT
jgi:hypothetical protein